MANPIAAFPGESTYSPPAARTILSPHSLTCSLGGPGATGRTGDHTVAVLEMAIRLRNRPVAVRLNPSRQECVPTDLELASPRRRRRLGNVARALLAGIAAAVAIAGLGVALAWRSEIPPLASVPA